MRLLGIRLLCALILGGLLIGAAPYSVAEAQSSTGSITGTVTSSDGVALSGADLSIAGATKSSLRSGDDGSFSFPALAPGIYSITARKASFIQGVTTDLVVAAGATVNVSIVLQPTSFSSLSTIGNVTASKAQSTINTSPAAITTIPGSVFADQGLQQVTAVLNETPGVTMNVPNNKTNISGSSMMTTQVPQLRGALPYETESLIDGHPVSVGAFGYFTPLFVNPNQLEDVEIVKGPGSMPTDINYAVGGSINYITLKPTAVTRATIALTEDSYGGLSTNVRATGTTLNGHLGYAFAFGIDGTPGPLAGFPAVAGVPEEALGGISTANGVPICGTAAAGTGCLTKSQAPPAGFLSTFSPTYTIVSCCYNLLSQYLARAELGKIVYNFSTQSSLEIAYLGGQSTGADEQEYYNPQQLFVPAAGYTGSVPAGSQIPFGTDTYSAWQNSVTQGLLESEFRTSVGPASLLFRYYTGANNSVLAIGNQNFAAPYTFTANTWGSLPIGPGGTTVFFNGTPVTYSAVSSGQYRPTLDHFSGLSGEVDLPMGNNVYTLSVDRTTHNSFSANLFPIQSENSISIPNGASQAFTTFLARGQFMLGPTVSAQLANYFVNYSTHYTPNGGTSWNDATQSFYGPRFALTWRPSADESVRLALGSSIAPPYLSLVNTQGGAPVPNNTGVPNYYTQTINTGNVQPETGFGYDLGSDTRLRPDTILSGDIYLTNLHGQYLTSVTSNGTYTPTAAAMPGLTAPLFVSATENLGSSLYAGLELALRKTPAAGWGYTVQGALERAYVYNLPGLYNTASGPFTTNLGVIPYINFQPTGRSFTGSSGNACGSRMAPATRN